MQKIFQGQGKNEKVLYIGKKFLLYYIISNSINIGSILLIIIIFLFILFNISSNIGIIFGIVSLGLLFWISYTIRKGNYLIITNQRVIKFVKEGVFSSNFKELKLTGVTDTKCIINGLLDQILGCGSVAFRCGNVAYFGKDSIHVNGIKYANELILYVSRLIDFQKANPDIDISQINCFIPRKERHRKNSINSNI